MKKAALIIILLGTLNSCLPESHEDIKINDALMPYFETFAEEAELRGFTFDWEASRIEGYISDLSVTGVLGQCVHDNLDPDRVIIDQDFWAQASTFDKEFIVFHELGHCYLNRNHKDDVDADGLCVSLMNSGSQRCRANYTSETRESYLDELFDL
jgi:Zn-dependent peptidase ImmA (M78 family)